MHRTYSVPHASAALNNSYTRENLSNIQGHSLSLSWHPAMQANIFESFYSTGQLQGAHKLCQDVVSLTPSTPTPLTSDGEAFSQLRGLTSEFNWGGGGGAEETLLLVSLYFFGKIGGSNPPRSPGSAFPANLSIFWENFVFCLFVCLFVCFAVSIERKIRHLS